MIFTQPMCVHEIVRFTFDVLGNGETEYHRPVYRCEKCEQEFLPTRDLDKPYPDVSGAGEEVETAPRTPRGDAPSPPASDRFGEANSDDWELCMEDDPEDPECCCWKCRARSAEGGNRELRSIIEAGFRSGPADTAGYSRALDFLKRELSDERVCCWCGRTLSPAYPESARWCSADCVDEARAYIAAVPSASVDRVIPQVCPECAKPVEIRVEGQVTFLAGRTYPSNSNAQRGES